MCSLHLQTWPSGHSLGTSMHSHALSTQVDVFVMHRFFVEFWHIGETQGTLPAYRWRRAISSNGWRAGEGGLLASNLRRWLGLPGFYGKNMVIAKKMVKKSVPIASDLNQDILQILVVLTTQFVANFV